METQNSLSFLSYQKKIIFTYKFSQSQKYTYKLKVIDTISETSSETFRPLSRHAIVLCPILNILGGDAPDEGIGGIAVREERTYR